MTRKFSIDSAVFLAGFTSILYTWSAAHYHGFLMTLQLDAYMLERSFHQMIYNGLLVSFAPILLLFFGALSVMCAFSHIIIPGYVDWTRKSINVKRKVIKFRRSWFGKRNAPPIEVRAKAKTTQVAFMAVIGLLYVASLKSCEAEGANKAKKILDSHLVGENVPSAMIKVKIDNDEKTLRFLGCGANSCAGIEEKSNRVYYYSTSVGYSYMYQKHEDTPSEIHKEI